jgi:DnaK suppressor protein
MPAKKAAAKKKKKTGSAKKTAKRTSRRKTVAKKPAARRSTSKKAAARKKAGAKKKPAARKKAGAKKKPAARKKAGAKKKPAAKKKAGAKKKPATKKAAARRPSRKRTTTAKRAPRQRSATRGEARANLLTGPVRGFEPYRPRRGEPYMSDGQLEHFRELLLAWKRELMEEVDRTVLHMKDDAANFPDPNDRATQESEFGLELRTRDRERKLLKKIDSALLRIDEGTYGYCEETGEDIGLRRLEARPVATLCVEAQERRELAERQFRDREDYYR